MWNRQINFYIVWLGSWTYSGFDDRPMFVVVKPLVDQSMRLVGEVLVSVMYGVQNIKMSYRRIFEWYRRWFLRFIALLVSYVSGTSGGNPW